MFLRLSQARPEPNTSESGRHNHIRETFNRGSRHKRSRGKRPTPMFLTICATNHVGAECPNCGERAPRTAAAVRALAYSRPAPNHPQTRRSRQRPASGSDHSNIRPRLRMRQEGVKKCVTDLSYGVRCISAASKNGVPTCASSNTGINRALARDVC
jgi:hypothetical protein